MHKHKNLIHLSDQLIGSLVYRTQEAFNKDISYLKELKKVVARGNNEQGKFYFRYYTGSSKHLKDILKKIEEKELLNCISLLNFQPTKSEKNTFSYDLVMILPGTLKEYISGKKNSAFELFLRPIYVEFMKQLIQSSFFQLTPRVYPSHDYYEIYAIGDLGGFLCEKYGRDTDAIEIHNLRLNIKKNWEEETLVQIWNENDLVTNIINE